MGYEMNLEEKKTEIMTIVQRIQSGAYDDFLGYLQDKNDLEKCIDELIKYAKGYKQATDNLLSPMKGKTETSEQAAKKVALTSKSMRYQILQYLERNSTANFGHKIVTCLHLERELGLKHQTCSARITELKKAGWVEVIARFDGHDVYNITREGAVVLTEAKKEGK